jgi:hypothetical protein
VQGKTETFFCFWRKAFTTEFHRSEARTTRTTDTSSVLCLSVCLSTTFPWFYHPQQNHASEHPTQKNEKKKLNDGHIPVKDPPQEKETQLQRTAHHHFNNPLCNSFSQQSNFKCVGEK